MADITKQTEKQLVADYFRRLNHPLKTIVQALREIVLLTDTEIAEQIKWNSACFYYNGEMTAFNPKEYKRDIVVFNLYKQDSVLLVFPTGGIVNDSTGLLEGKFKDSRKIAKFGTLEDVKMKEKDLQFVIREWLKLVEK
ncbi:DUF1801 domain-containing protein [Daejeonella oryzae]|uniref:DUF1801 domain-containing protein n=1 Tax=Daejeonella oryzae TaxID=1122943 RepID=UPI00040A6BCD|nr:DUF1801 domain-containing protein [Daejeonella oryzae]